MKESFCTSGQWSSTAKSLPSGKEEETKGPRKRSSFVHIETGGQADKYMYQRSKAWKPETGKCRYWQRRAKDLFFFCKAEEVRCKWKITGKGAGRKQKCKRLGFPNVLPSFTTYNFIAHVIILGWEKNSYCDQYCTLRVGKFSLDRLSD